MKRWFTFTLALVMLLSPMQGMGITAFAEAEEVSVQVEEAVEAEEFDIGAPDDLDEVPEAILEADTEEQTLVGFEVRYGTIKKQTEVGSKKDAENAALKVIEGGTVLILDASEGWVKVAFNTEHGIASGYVPADAVTELDADQIGAYLDDQAQSGSCVLYEDNADMPLETLACEFTETTEIFTKAGEDADDSDAMFAAKGFAVKCAAERIAVGETCAISGVDAAGTDVSDALTYESTDPDVAAVSADGVVTGVSVGTTEIKVTYNGNVISKAIEVVGEPDSIRIEPETLALGAKETHAALNVVMLPEGSTSSVTWTSSNAKIVQVDAETGVLYGAKAGTATITATTAGGRTASCAVKVAKAPTKVDLALSATTLCEGDTVMALPSVNDKSACDTFTYTSSNAGVATVDEDGVITGKGTGTATITATSYNGKKGTATVTVYGMPASVAFEGDRVTVGVGQNLYLTPDVYSADGKKTVATMSYELLSESEAGVVSLDSDKGTLRGVKLGTAVIKGTTYNGVTCTANVSVVPAPTSVTLNATSKTVAVKETYAGLKALLIMSDGTQVTDGGAVWSTSNAKVAIVDEDTGVITGLKSGTANIVARTYNGLTATCKVTVGKAPTKIALEPDVLKLSAGGMTGQIGVTFPKKTGCASLSFTSSNPAVATVDDDGVVTSVGEGKATITVQTFNGKSASCTVQVLGEPARVSLDDAELVIGQGQSVTLNASATSAAGGEAQTNFTYYIHASSPNPGSISVNGTTGVVTALSQGTAVVGVRAHNGIEADAPCTITVMPAPVAVIMPSDYTVGVGETANPIPVQIRYSNGEIQDASSVTWSSSKPKIVAVDSATGALKGVKKGAANVTVKTYNGKTATCKVTVIKGPSSITLSPTALKLAAGGMKFALSASLSSGTSSDITFKSSDESVATVDANGVITTVGKGSATIYAQTFNSKTATCALTVTGKPAKASFASDSVTLAVSESVTPSVKVVADDGTDAMADLTFKVVSGSDVIKLDSTTGEITAVKTGTSVVSVETHNGVVADNDLTVIVKGAGSTMFADDNGFGITNGTELTLGEGQTHTIAVNGASSVTWSTSKKSVATVDEYGVITAKDTGSATITGTDGNGKTTTISVTVKKAPSSVSLSPAEGVMTVGTTNQYTVTLSSSSAGSYTFVSSDSSIASVTDEGVVTAKKAGKVTITVTTYNGKTASATLTVQTAAAVDVPAEMEKLGIASYTDYYSSSMTNAQKLEHVIYMGQTQLGKPYIYGGGYKDPEPKGFDCSGFVYWCFYYGTDKAIKLGDSAYKQGYDSSYPKISGISDLVRGDVVCFNTVDDDDLSDHTGIYLGKGYFIHASSAGGEVMISNLSSGYYNRNFSWGRRILG